MVHFGCMFLCHYSKCEYQVCICKCVWCILDSYELSISSVLTRNCEYGVVCTHVKCQYQVCICKWWMAFCVLTRIVNIKYAYVSVYGAFWMYVFVSYSNCEYQVCICKCVWCILDVCFCVLLELWISSMHM